LLFFHDVIDGDELEGQGKGIISFQKEPLEKQGKKEKKLGKKGKPFVVEEGQGYPVGKKKAEHTPCQGDDPCSDEVIVGDEKECLK
jgi:hypothetical protein